MYRHVHRHTHGHVQRHAYRHVYRRAYRHVHRHAYRHVYRHAYNLCVDMCADMCMDIYTGTCTDMYIEVVLHRFCQILWSEVTVGVLTREILKCQSWLRIVVQSVIFCGSHRFLRPVIFWLPKRPTLFLNHVWRLAAATVLCDRPSWLSFRCLSCCRYCIALHYIALRCISLSGTAQHVCSRAHANRLFVVVPFIVWHHM